MNENVSIDSLWKLLEEHQNETFYTLKKLPFTYTVKGGELFVDRRSKSITKATFGQALNKLKENPDQITGPKSLNVFGAPYIWALFKAFHIA
ncbi:MAG: hypothetical protein NC400_06010 [Clostridium sp.]|nr:hypothetical protein [Clostridium sp.]